MRYSAAISIAIVLAPLTLAGQWHSLFDGKTLDGWIQRGGKAQYSVVNGAIVGTAVVNTPNSFLCTEATFGDFILELEVKQVGACNSGIQFRSLSDPDYRDGRVHGYQCEIDPSSRNWSGGIFDEARRGWLYKPQLQPWTKVYQYGRWNHIRIEAIGKRLRTWGNGIPVSHLVDDKTAEGFIALQVHSINSSGRFGSEGDTIHWRNIRIQTEDLTPRAFDERIMVVNTIPNTIDEAEVAQGWRLLWDGKTTDGWRRAHEDQFPEEGWKIEDGVLKVLSSGGGEAQKAGDIVTEEEFDAFEIQLDFLITEGANSGIKYFVTEGYGMRVGVGSAIGLEFQILDDERHPDAKAGAAGNRTIGSLYDLIPSRKQFAKRPVPGEPGAWQHARVVARRDGAVEHWLNGIQVVEYNRFSPLFASLVARSKYADWEGFGAWESGHLLLQDHGDEVHFRSIKVREL